MKGLELSRLYYETYGRPMLEEQFAPYLDRIAVGLVGHGSECFGYDDELSRDHDFGPGFCLWLRKEDEEQFGFKLFRAYSKLPKEFMGCRVQKTSLFGSDGQGVQSIGEFYSRYTPGGAVPECLEEWLSIPDFYLAEATNGAVFTDPLGDFSAIREGLLKDCPEDVWLKKLASAVFYMAQAGQYNYLRCLSHGEQAAAACALTEFVQNAARGAYLLCRRYMPYYKWAFRGLKELPILPDLARDLTELLKAPYDKEKNAPLIEKIAADFAREIRARGLSERTEDYLEGYAYCIRNCIKDVNLRNAPVML